MGVVAAGGGARAPLDRLNERLGEAILEDGRYYAGTTTAAAPLFELAAERMVEGRVLLPKRPVPLQVSPSKTIDRIQLLGRGSPAGAGLVGLGFVETRPTEASANRGERQGSVAPGPVTHR